jgi:roadblock/LC7 domain-containing protein
MTTTSAPIQGVAAPDVVVSPADFYRNTRRMRFAMSPNKAYSGLGAVDTVQLRQVGIVAALELRVSGSIVIGGTLGAPVMSYDWPYNLIQNLQLSANGQSNLISCRGLTLKAFNFTTNPRLDDSGVTQKFGGATVSTGTLSMPTDVWGTDGGANVLAPGTAIAALGTYTFDVTFIVPVAADQTSLVGSIYAQSSATNLALNVQWATQAQLESTISTATFTPTINWAVTGVAYSIPNVNGKFCVPDLSQFHQLTENQQGGLVQNQNQYILPGTGVGRQLLRLFWQVFTGANRQPLPVTATNYAQVDWAYGGSDVPESYPNGTQLRAENIQQAGVDLGGNWGIGLWDFASIFALRDSIDEGSTTNLRLEFSLVGAPTTGVVSVAQETLFAAAVGA